MEQGKSERATPVRGFNVREELRRKAPFTRKLGRWWRAVKNEETSARKLGIAVALGVFLGASPFYGFQVLLCLLLATILRLNKIAVLLGVQVSAPPMMPFLMFADLQLGSLIVAGHWAPLDFGNLKKTPVSAIWADFVLPFVVGCFVIGLVLAAIMGLITFRVVTRHQRAKAGQPHLSDGEFEALLDRLDPLPLRYRSYAHWKARWDPIYRLALPHLVGRRQVVDLGGGLGILAALLAGRSPETSVRLVDWDERKLAFARQVLTGLPQLLIEQGDARTMPLGSPDGVVLADVLHYSPVQLQQEWLERCAQALAPGGVLLVRELGEGKSVARWVDALMQRVGWNRGTEVTAWPIEEMIRTLEQQGCSCQVMHAGNSAFRTNTLIVAHKT